MALNQIKRNPIMIMNKSVEYPYNIMIDCTPVNLNEDVVRCKAIIQVDIGG